MCVYAGGAGMEYNGQVGWILEENEEVLKGLREDERIHLVFMLRVAEG